MLVVVQAEDVVQREHLLLGGEEEGQEEGEVGEGARRRRRRVRVEAEW